MTDHNTMIREMRASLERHIEDMRACKTDDLIFAWPYGLGVVFSPEGKPGSTRLIDATGIDKASPYYNARIENGHGVRARLMRRQVALELHIKSTEELLTNPSFTVP